MESSAPIWELKRRTPSASEFWASMNYGSVAYTEFLNWPHAEGVFEGVRVVAAYPIGSDDYPDSAKLGAQWKDQLLKMYQSPKAPKDAVPTNDK